MRNHLLYRIYKLPVCQIRQLLRVKQVCLVLPDVAFVATSGNTIYAINADNGQILLSRNF
jgi:hypothetical protein